jgi:hypothetical protein
MSRGLLVFVLACGGGDREPAPAPAAPTPPRAATAATRLAATFAPDVVGSIVPIDATPGDYAMSIELTFDTYPTMELHISARRTGVWRLVLAADGTATACMGSRTLRSSLGQVHYEKDPAKRRHSETDERHLTARAGTWKLNDGVATIVFDSAQWNGCALTDNVVPTPPLELRCIGIDPPANVSERRLACEGNESEMHGLGLPLTTAKRVANKAPMRDAAVGPNVIFGAPGLAVEVRQTRGQDLPSYRFVPKPIQLVEAHYLPAPKIKKP